MGTYIDESFDCLGESLVSVEYTVNNFCPRSWYTHSKILPHTPTNNGLRLGDVIPLLIRCRISVGVRNKRESRIDEVRLRNIHQVRAGNRLDLSIFVELGSVSECQKDTTAGPREFVTQWVIGAFGSWEATCIAEERGDLAALGVDLRLTY